MPPTLGLFLSIGAVFGALAAGGAYAIAYNEYRQRMLRMDQNPRKMALETAAVAFLFIMAASFVLAFVLNPENR